MLDIPPPAAPASRFPVAENLCRVVSNKAVNAEYRLLLAEAGDTALSARAGQFFHLLCPPSDAGRPYLRRPMSIYRIDRERRQIGFLYKVAGTGTRGLAGLVPGDTLNALGPLGQGFTLPPNRRHVLMVARGVGLATLAPLARLSRDAGARATAFLSARSPDLLMSRDELEAAGARVVEVTDTDGSSAPDRLRAAILEAHLAEPFDFAATCGSNRLFHMLKSLCADWGIPGETALEARMGCGTGMCHACVVPVGRDAQHTEYKRVCREGPVFSLVEARGW